MREAMAVEAMCFEGDRVVGRSDLVAVEEPLEIRMSHGPLHQRQRTVLAVTMRTPGHDDELAVGYALSEGVLNSREDLIDTTRDAPNEIRLHLRPGLTPELGRLTRHGYSTSSCGVCGKTSIDAVIQRVEPLQDDFRIPASLVPHLPQRLAAVQTNFQRTGGVHASALFDNRGERSLIREDVGRHNAVDRVIGSRWLAGLTCCESILFVSARASFELIQKAALARIPVFAAVGAPTSLAVDLARELNVTLLAFVRDGRFTVYAGQHRILTDATA